MNFFDNIIITQKSAFTILSFIVLFFGTVINFSFSGLFVKNSQKFSNIILIATLIIASICQLPLVFGFLNPSGLNSLFYFGDKIIVNGPNAFLCLLANLVVLAAFLISFLYLKKLRHKAYYYNSLFLCSCLGLNLLICSNDFTAFILSLETISICSLFMIWGFKNQKILYTALKYFVFSLAGTSIIILGYALSDGFSAQNTMLLVVSKIIFTAGLLIKGGFFLLFAQQRQGTYEYNYPSFVFLNTAVFFAYSIALFKTAQNLYQIGSLAQMLFVALFTLSLPLCALKITRAKNFWDFALGINCFNYCILALIFFILTPQTACAGIFGLLNILIAICAILSAGAIIDINQKHKSSCLQKADFKGICHRNIFFCSLFSIALFIIGGIMPSGIMTSRVLGAIELAKTGLWSTVVIFFMAVGCAILITAVINFAKIMYQKPAALTDLRKSEFKKRTKLNYFILFAFVIISILLCFYLPV